jgi:hypothetical protein
MSVSTVYLPPAGDRPAEPAPYVLTDEDVARFMRLDCSDVYQSLKRYRLKGWLKGTQLGNHVRYLLPDVLKACELAKEGNPR